MNLDQDLLHELCPMHLRLDADGVVTQTGPTFRKLVAEPPVGRRFFDLLEPVHPGGVREHAALAAASGRKLRLRLRDAPRTVFVAHALPDGKGGTVVDLAFGINAPTAVRDHALTASDFAPTDMTVELLFLLEAKSAAMDSVRRLNRRLQNACTLAKEQAFTDVLTGLGNRRAADRELARLAGCGEPFALIQVDLDCFKEVNDGFGHAAGDAVLQEVSRRLLRTVREADTAARIGGDEFLLILPGLRTETRLRSLARRLVRALKTPIPVGHAECEISASLGSILHGGGTAPDAATLIDRCDRALYAAKHAGGGRARVWSAAPA